MKRKTKGENILRALLKYLRNYKKETVLAPLFKLLEASFELFVPLVMAAIIDHGIGQADGVYVLKMSGMFDYCSVFCCKGSHRIFYGAAS